MDTFLHKLTVKGVALTNKDRKDIERYVLISEGISTCLKSINDVSSKKKLGQLLKKTQFFKKMHGGATIGNSTYYQHAPALFREPTVEEDRITLQQFLNERLFDELLNNEEKGGGNLLNIHNFINSTSEPEYFKSIIINKIISNGYHRLFELAIRDGDFITQDDTVPIAIQHKMYNMIVPLIERGAKYDKESVIKCIVNDTDASTNVRALIKIDNKLFKFNDFLKAAILLQNFDRFESIISINPISLDDREALIKFAFKHKNIGVVVYLFYEFKDTDNYNIIEKLLKIFNKSKKGQSQQAIEWLAQENADYKYNKFQPSKKLRRTFY